VGIDSSIEASSIQIVNITNDTLLAEGNEPPQALDCELPPFPQIFHLPGVAGAGWIGKQKQ
jgi:hypothetical protein